MKTDALRNIFLDYFKAKDHRVIPSDSLIPGDDPTLLFTGAGMNQFKPYFLGIKKDMRRAASCQKCVRTADLERVGVTAYHHTFFEMLGNFSFGDYFKEGAIQMAWEFVTKELKLNREELWVSVYKDDSEAYDLWRRKIGIPEARIMRYDAEDNFWPSNAPTLGPNGPCGPCSEIYYGAEAGKGVEIWNLVFTEFDRQEGGILSPLPQKNIDTGMGLERLAAVIQKVESNFDIDIFKRLADSIELAAGAGIWRRAPRPAQNALLDHLRAVAFSVTDGIIPSNEGRGYVVRKLIRKCAMHLRDIGHEGPMLHRLIPAVTEIMGKAYPELGSRSEATRAVILREEEAIWDILEKKVPEAEIKVKTLALTVKPGQEEFASRCATEMAFGFYDTHGVPRDVLEKILAENKLQFSAELFEKLMGEQRDRSRAGSKISGDIFATGDDPLKRPDIPATAFSGYERLEEPAKILALFSEGAEVERLQKGQKGIVVTDRSPFYAEQGGQLGDQGLITGDGHEVAFVENAQSHDGKILHHVEVKERGLCTGENIRLKVDKKRREAIQKNHTATHLLHGALRKVLGTHVQQRGSLVAPDRLRFDFSHHKAMKPEEIREVEAVVQKEIAAQRAAEVREEDTKKAIAGGAMAFFGDKYGERVRVVSVGGFSTELCGGTHVRNTGEIGDFKIISEGSIQAGVRRIEAVTAQAANALRREIKNELAGLEEYFGAQRKQLRGKIEGGRKEIERLRRELKGGFQKKLRREIHDKLRSAEERSGTRILAQKVPGLDANGLREIADWARSQFPSAAVVFACEQQDKPQIVVALTKDLLAKGLKAGEIVKKAAAVIGGSGGGKPDMALGGGKPGSDAGAALAEALDLVKRVL